MMLNLSSVFTAQETFGTGSACARVPGTCGELVQGTLDGLPCLVSCPIRFYNSVTLTLREQPGWLVPAQAVKAAEALVLGLKRWGAPAPGGLLTLKSNLPAGRGYASSTADIGATLFALAALCGRELDSYEAIRLSTSIEPSDSSFFEGLCLLEYRQASLIKQLGPAPALPILVFDPGGCVDTIIFNRENHHQALQKLAPQHRSMFDIFEKSLINQDWSALGEAATLSARLHQAILFNPLLDKIQNLGADLHALGVCRAHSGTLLGLIFDPNRQDMADSLAYLTRRLPENIGIRMQSLIGGGVDVQP
ncbi:MAG: hypothetical protein LWX83_12490 [Anaerolineae bacterium]|nr:hypothetical protein [Anaerolineae bacterium]